ncbi:hypothetical protein MHYP_G00094860 [Metynnis hypsauchen]
MQRQWWGYSSSIACISPKEAQSSAHGPERAASVMKGKHPFMVTNAYKLRRTWFHGPLVVRACWSGSQRFGELVVSLEREPEQLQIADRSLPLIPHSIRLLWAPNGRACRIYKACRGKSERSIRLGWMQSNRDRWM